MNTGSELLAVLAGIATVLGAPMAVWTLLANHERQRKEATITYYHTVSWSLDCIRDNINEVFGQNVINISDPQYNGDSKDAARLRSAIDKYLNNMERFSVGINARVYDFNIFDRIAGQATIKRYKQLEPVIEKRRNDLHYPIYSEFERMVTRLQSKHKLNPKNNGKIRGA